tara:strand:- start:1249 stop:2076 length:828 start_codon:yes stop_codon:yes gene_type:complete
MSKIVILVNTCDTYSDVWELLIRSLEEYLPSYEIPIYFNTETKNSLSFKTKLDINFINNDELRWGKRLKRCLCEINEEFVLNIFDDYLLEDRLDDFKLKEALDLLEHSENLSAVYLNSVSNRYHKNIPNFGFREIKNYTEYRVNSAPGIWRKKDLFEITHNEDTPWSWEVFGTYRSFKPRRYFLSISAIEDNIFPYNYKKGGAIYRGKWVADVVDNKIKKYNASIDTSIRGYSDNTINEKRNLSWKLNFIKLGYKTDGLKVLWHIFFYLRNKLNI